MTEGVDIGFMRFMERSAINVNNGRRDPHDNKPLPEKLMPDVSSDLIPYIAAAVRVIGDIWMVGFHFPLFPEDQERIKQLIEAEEKIGKVWKEDKVPTTKVSVTEVEPDMSKPAVDGIQPTKEVESEKDLNVVCHRYQFAGIARKPLAEITKPKPTNTPTKIGL